MAVPHPLQPGVHGTLSALEADVASQMRRRQFTALLEHSPQPIMILDAEGRVREWNPAAEHLLGWTRSEVLGGVVGLIPNDSRAQCDRTWSTLSAGGSEPAYHTVRLHRDGRHIPVRVHTAAIQEADGCFAGVVSTLSQPMMDAGPDVVDMAGALLAPALATAADTAQTDPAACERVAGALECD